MERPAAKLLEAIRQGTLGALPAGELTAAALTARNASGNTPFHLAARNGRLRDLPADGFQGKATEIVAALVAENGDPVAAAARNGLGEETPKWNPQIGRAHV